MPSRPNIDSVEIQKIDLKSIINAQQFDDKLRNLLNSSKVNNSFSLIIIIFVPIEENPVCCKVSTKTNRPYLPKLLRRTVFEIIHNLSHPSIRVTRKLVTAKYFWPGMNKDINTWSKCCIPCQKSKVTQDIQNHQSVSLSFQKDVSTASSHRLSRSFTSIKRIYQLTNYYRPIFAMARSGFNQKYKRVYCSSKNL